MGVINITGITGGSPPYIVKVFKTGETTPVFSEVVNTTSFNKNFTHENGFNYYAVVEKSGCSSFTSGQVNLNCILCDQTSFPTGIFTVEEIFNYTNNFSTPITIDIAFYAVNIPDRLIIKKNNTVVKDTGCVGEVPSACQASANCQSSGALGYYITLFPNDNLKVLVDGKCSNNQNTCWGSRIRCNSGLTSSVISINNSNCTMEKTVTSFVSLNTEPPVGCNITTNYVTQECVSNGVYNIKIASSSSLGSQVQYGIIVGTNSSGIPPSSWSEGVSGEYTFSNINKGGESQFSIWSRDVSNTNCFTVLDYLFNVC